MGITVTATSIQPKDITINETGETISITDSTATVSNIVKDTLTLTLAGSTTNLGDLANVEITSIADGQLLVYESSSSKWKNSASSTGVTSVNTQTGAVVLDTDDIQEDGAPTNRYFTDARARSSISVTDAGGDGSLAYNSSSGVITYTGPSASEVRAHFTGGTGVTITDGDIAIGQSVGTTDDVTFAEITGDEFIGNLRGATLIKAQAGEALTKGDVVYISGVSGNTPVVSKADADDSAKMPAVGLANATVLSSASVDVLAFGQISNIDTTQNIGGTWAEGDSLYVNTTAGQLTKTQPTGETSLVQKIAKIEKVHATTGLLLIQGAGRTNATPNLNDGNIFIGDSSNYATTSSLDTEVAALGYIKSETDSQTLSFSSPNLSISNGNSVDISAITSGYVTPSSTDTFTNKTFDANGTGNSLSNVEVADFAAASIVTASEGIGSNNNDTTIPTSAAVKAYADSVGGGSGTITALNNQAENRLVSIGSTTTELDGEANLTFNGSTLVLAGNLDIDINSGGTRHTEFTNSSATGSGLQGTLGTGGVSHTSGNHYIFRTATASGYSTKATLAGDGTHTFEADSSAHGSTMPLVLKTTNSGYNRQQLRFDDAGNSTADVVLRKAGDSQILQFVLDTGQDTTYATGDAVGDHAVYHIKDGANDRVNTTIYGANDSHRYSVFQGNSGSYAAGDMLFAVNDMTIDAGGTSTVTGVTSYMDQPILTVHDDAANGYGRNQLKLKSNGDHGNVGLAAVSNDANNRAQFHIHPDPDFTPTNGDAKGDYLAQIIRDHNTDEMKLDFYGANTRLRIGSFAGNSDSYGYSPMRLQASKIELYEGGNAALTVDNNEIEVGSNFNINKAGDFTIKADGQLILQSDADSSGNDEIILKHRNNEAIKISEGPGGDPEVVVKGDAFFIKDENNNTLFSIDASASQQGGSFVNTDSTKTGILELKRDDSGTTTYNTSYTFRTDANDRKFYLEVSDNVGSDGVTEIFSVEDSGGSATATPKDIVKFSVPPVVPVFAVGSLPTTVVQGAQALATGCNTADVSTGIAMCFYNGTDWKYSHLPATTVRT